MEEKTQASVGYWRLLKHNHRFRQLWVAQIVSELGDWLNLVALFQIIKQFSGNAQDTGLLVILQMLPMFILSPISGMVADRFNRRNIMIICDLLRFVVVLGLLTIKRPDQLWLLYMLSTLQFSLTAFFEPARSAIIPNLAKEEELLHANVLSGITWSTMLAIGGALGGFISDRLGNQVAFIVDAASFLVSAGILLRLSVEAKNAGNNASNKAEEVKSNVSFAEIFPYLRKNPRVIAVSLVKAGICITAGGVWLLSTIYGQRVFPIGQDGAVSVGILYGVHGLGALLGALFTGRFFKTSILSSIYIILLAFILRSIFFGFWAASPNISLVSISVIFVTACGSLLWSISTTLMQKLTEDRIRGRIFALEGSLLTLTMAISVSLTGRSIDIWGFSPAKATFFTALVGLVVALFWAVVIVLWKKWDKTQEQVVIVQ